MKKILIMIMCCIFVPGEDIVTNKKGLMYTTEAAFAAPFAYHDWQEGSSQEEEGSLGLEQNEFQGTVLVKGVESQVCWRVNFRGNLFDVQWNPTFLSSLEKSKMTLQGKVHHNGYSQNVKCVVQAYFVLQLQGPLASLDWRGGEGQGRLLPIPETGTNTTRTKECKVYLDQLQETMIWKIEGFKGLKPIVQIKIQPHFQVKRRVG